MVTAAELGRLFRVNRQRIYELTRRGLLVPASTDSRGRFQFSVGMAEDYFGYAPVFDEPAPPYVPIDELMKELGPIDDAYLESWLKENPLPPAK